MWWWSTCFQSHFIIPLCINYLYQFNHCSLVGEKKKRFFSVFCTAFCFYKENKGLDECSGELLILSTSFGPKGNHWHDTQSPLFIIKQSKSRYKSKLHTTYHTNETAAVHNEVVLFLKPTLTTNKLLQKAVFFFFNFNYFNWLFFWLKTQWTVLRTEAKSL